MELKAQLEALRTQYNGKLAEADALAQKHAAKPEEMPVDVAQQIDRLLGEADEMKARLDTLTRLNAQGDPMPTQAAQVSWRQSGPTEGEVPIDEKSWREVEVQRVQIDPIYGIPMVVNQKVRFHMPLGVQHKDYEPAFEAYLRKSYNDLGPTDRKTLSEGVDSAGGFLVPEDYMVNLIKKIATLATIRPNARVATTSRDIAKWPKLVYTTDDKYTSGVRFTWTGETPASATAHRVTDPVYGLYSIPVHTAMASLPLTNDLIEDSAFDVLGISSDLLSEAFALGENDVFINGTGAAQPRGVLTDVNTANGPAQVVSGDASTLLANGIIDLAYALPAQYENNAKFYMSKATEKVIRKFVSATSGDYLWPVVSGVGNLGPAPRMILDYPVVRDEFMPAIAGNAFPILFGDMRGYLILDRVGLAIQRLTELYAETNITLLLARKRVGGQLVEPWRLRAQKVST